MFESSNHGDSWSLIPSTKDKPVVGLALLKAGSGLEMYGYRALKANPGLYRSTDNGKSWEPLGTGTKGLILQLAIAPTNPQRFYAISKDNEVFQSQDDGKTWKKLS